MLQTRSRINLLTKPEKDGTRRKNYRSISFVNMDSKILNKILAKPNQKCVFLKRKENVLALLQEYTNSLTLGNPLT